MELHVYVVDVDGRIRDVGYVINNPGYYPKRLDEFVCRGMNLLVNQKPIINYDTMVYKVVCSELHVGVE